MLRRRPDAGADRAGCGLGERRNRGRHHGELRICSGPAQLSPWRAVSLAPGEPRIRDSRFFRAGVLQGDRAEKSGRAGPLCDADRGAAERSKGHVYFIATRPGSYELTCADHDWAGMTARITVE